jgi:hypothetical protein
MPIVFDELNYRKESKNTQAKVLWKTNVQSQQKNVEKFKLW